MKRILTALPLVCSLCLAVVPLQADDWPQWRGPEGNNHAADETTVPLRWDVSRGENVVWKQTLPGRGHSTPIVVEDAIFLTAADDQAQTQSLLKLDRRSGRILDQWVIHRGKLPASIHNKNSHASPSPAYDGQHVYTAFHQDDAIYVTAVTTSGRPIWQQRVADFQPRRYPFGYGASPIVENDLVIVAVEYDGEDSGLYALDARTGQRVWSTPRPSNQNYASPIVATIAGQRQILLAGAEMICAYDPPTGRLLWQVETSTEAIAGTVVWDDRFVMIGGGHPDAGTWCVSATGEKQLMWQNNVKTYEQSLLAINGYVFAIADTGVAYCWRTHDGKEMWKARLCRGGISASPLLVDDRLIAASEDGEVFQIAASPDRFQLLSENQAGRSLFASPIAVDDRLYLRTADGDGADRQEYLVAIGNG